MKIETTTTGCCKNPGSILPSSEPDPNSLFPAGRQSSYPARYQRIASYSILFNQRVANSLITKPFSGFLQFFAVFCVHTCVPRDPPPGTPSTRSASTKNHRETPRAFRSRRTELPACLPMNRKRNQLTETGPPRLATLGWSILSREIVWVSYDPNYQPLDSRSQLTDITEIL